jgi:hypothetical protein
MIKLKTLLLNKHDTSTRLTRIQSLNEGIFRKKGKLKDLIKNLFNRGGNNEQIVQEIDPYLVKYGRYAGNPCTVDGTNLMITSNEQLSNSEAKSEIIFCTIFIITDDPQPLPDDASKNSTNISYALTFQKTEGNTITQFYQYFKSVFLVDGVVTDEISQLRETGNKFTCSTSTLENKGSGCTLPQEVTEIVLNAFKDNEKFFEVQSYLNKLR